MFRPFFLITKNKLITSFSWNMVISTKMTIFELLVILKLLIFVGKSLKRTNLFVVHLFAILPIFGGHFLSKSFKKLTNLFKLISIYWLMLSKSVLNELGSIWIVPKCIFSFKSKKYRWYSLASFNIIPLNCFTIGRLLINSIIFQ